MTTDVVTPPSHLSHGTVIITVDDCVVGAGVSEVIVILPVGVTIEVVEPPSQVSQGTVTNVVKTKVVV